MSGFGVFTEREGDAIRLLVTGDLDRAGVAALDRAARRAEYERPDVLVFDLRAAEELDLPALDLLAQAAARARRENRRCVGILPPGMPAPAELEVAHDPASVLPGHRPDEAGVEEVDRLRAGYDAFNRRDFEAFLADVAPDAEWWVDALPGPELYEGREGARRYCEQLAAAFDGWSSEPEEFLVSGDEIVARGTITVAGGRLKAPFVHVWRFRDGRAARVQLLGRPDGLRPVISH